VAQPDLQDYLRPEDITQEYLQGVLDESVPRHQEILELVDPIGHDDDQIKQRIWVQQEDRRASIVGFSDRYPRVRGRKVEEMRISPFTVKNARPFTVEDDELELDSEMNPMISEQGIVDATNFLERLRATLQVNALLSAINDKQFSYQDGDRTLTIPYSEQVKDAPDPSNFWDNSSLDPYYETNILKENFFADTGQVPDLVMLSGLTSANVLTGNKMDQAFQKQQPSDPEVQTFEEFTFNDMTFRVFRHKRVTPTGLKDAIDEGFGIVTVKEMAEDGTSPLKMHRAATKLNNRDPSGPRFDPIVDDSETKQISLGMYDNLIPGFGKRKIVQKWKMYTP